MGDLERAEIRALLLGLPSLKVKDFIVDGDSVMVIGWFTLGRRDLLRLLFHFKRLNPQHPPEKSHYHRCPDPPIQLRTD